MNVVELKRVCVAALSELEKYRNARPKVRFEDGVNEGKRGPREIGYGSVTTGTTLVRKSTLVSGTSGASTLRYGGGISMDRNTASRREVETREQEKSPKIDYRNRIILPKIGFEEPDTIDPGIISPIRNSLDYSDDFNRSSLSLTPLPGQYIVKSSSTSKTRETLRKRLIPMHSSREVGPEESVSNIYKQALESNAIGNYRKALREFAQCAKYALHLPSHPEYYRMNVVELNRILRGCLLALETGQSPRVVKQPLPLSSSNYAISKRIADEAVSVCLSCYTDAVQNASRASKGFAKASKMILAMSSHPYYSLMDQKLLSETAIACIESLNNSKKLDRQQRRMNEQSPPTVPFEHIFEENNSRLSHARHRSSAIHPLPIKSKSKRKLVIPQAVFEAFFDIGIYSPDSLTHHSL
jgi:hypothetical protein